MTKNKTKDGCQKCSMIPEEIGKKNHRDSKKGGKSNTKETEK